MADDLYVLTERLIEPGGLGQVARHAMRIGQPVDREECDELKGATILNVDYPRPLPTGNRNYAWTVFESDRIPESWVEVLNDCYRGAIVPHESVRRAFVDSGVEIPVHIVPQGFERHERTRPLPAREGPLRVGIVGVLVPRKNVTPLVEAVRALNARGYEIHLSVRLTCWLIPEMEHLIESTLGDPHVDAEFHEELSDEAIVDWYSGLHAYVLPSSGEGWSMTPRESTYLGIPTVVSDTPVHRELIEAGGGAPSATSGSEPAYYPFLCRTCGSFRTVTREAIEAALASLYDDYDDRVAAARAGARWIADRWRWDDVLARLADLLKRDG